MNLVCLDLEGVLLPEIWIATAEKTGIPELRRTTRDEPDYDKLMRYRLEILNSHGITIHHIQEAIGELNPLPGARDFVDWLIAKTRLIILSDTFAEFAHPLMEQLGFPTLFCHNLVIDECGRIVDYQLRQQDQKRRAVLALKSLNFEVLAAGDSYNDLTMLQSADHGVLFRPPESLSGEYPEFPVTQTHHELREQIAALLSL